MVEENTMSTHSNKSIHTLVLENVGILQHHHEMEKSSKREITIDNVHRWHGMTWTMGVNENMYIFSGLLY